MKEKIKQIFSIKRKESKIEAIIPEEPLMIKRIKLREEIKALEYRRQTLKEVIEMDERNYSIVSQRYEDADSAYKKIGTSDVWNLICAINDADFVNITGEQIRNIERSTLLANQWLDHIGKEICKNKGTTNG